MSDACTINIINDAYRIVNDNNRVTPKIVASLTDDLGASFTITLCFKYRPQDIAGK